MNWRNKNQIKKALFLMTWLLAVTALLLTGAVYRVIASRLEIVTNTPIVLTVPLSAFPMQIQDWMGKDVPISKNIQRVAGNDDFVNRLYTNQSNDQWANVYIAYSARPQNMIGHQPQVCYVAGGWVHDSTEISEVISEAGREVPCLVHRFHKPIPEMEEIVVLNFYIVNGLLTSNENVFTGVGWRTPNIAGDPARYVTQVQISSVLENAVRGAAKDMTELILDFFPDKDRRVRATEYTNAMSGVLR
jgi:hypothetical protein